MALTHQPGPFANNVYLHPPASMYELKLRAADYVRMEEMQTLHTKFFNDYAPSTANPTPQPPRPDPRPREPQQPRFTRYAPLNVPRSRLLDEALQANLIPPSRKTTIPPNADMVTQRGIEANPENCNAIIEMRSPTSVKEVQRLIGRLTTISHLLPKLAEQTQPIIQLLKKSAKFTWNDDYEQIFQKLKTTLTSPPILHKPDTHQPLLVYITTIDHIVSAALVQDVGGTQHPVYFVSKTLQDPESRYQIVEKLALSLVHAACRLRPYFQNHNIIVKTDYPIQKILQKPDLAGRMSSSAVELSEFNTCYKPHDPIKAQCLLDFVNDLQQTPEEDQWTLYFDGSSNPKGQGVGIVLEGPNDILIEKSLHFAFKTSNNQVEYEAILAGLSLAREVGVNDELVSMTSSRSTCKTDSKLTVGHLNDEFQIKDPTLLEYYHLVQKVVQSASEQVRIQHIPKFKNVRVDILSKLASTKLKSRHRSLLQ